MPFMVLRGVENEPVFFQSFDEAVSTAKEEAREMFEEGYLGECVIYNSETVAIINYKPTFEIELLDPEPEP